MAILKIIKYGDEVLRKPTKPVTKISSKIRKLINDMIDTMYAYDGVGLAAPQVGESISLFIIDASHDKDNPHPVAFINPKIIKKSGAFSSYEGCLSFPDVFTEVRRYANVTIKAQDRNGKPFIVEATGASLLVKALQHEYDHLLGTVFIDHVRNRFEVDEMLKQQGLPPINPDMIMDEPELEEEIQKTIFIDPDLQEKE